MEGEPGEPAGQSGIGAIRIDRRDIGVNRRLVVLIEHVENTA
jgi:hypothetical protein